MLELMVQLLLVNLLEQNKKSQGYDAQNEEYV
jgi:hypothetical protein